MIKYVNVCYYAYIGKQIKSKYSNLKVIDTREYGNNEKTYKF